MPSGRTVLWAAVWLLAALAALGVVAFLFDFRAHDELLVTVLIVAGHVVLAATPALLLVRGRSRVASWIALGLLVASAVDWLILVWGLNGSIDEDNFERFGFSALFSSFFAMQIGLLALCPVKGGALAVRWVAWVLGGAVLAYSLAVLFGDMWWRQAGEIWRVVGSAFVVCGAATLATPLLWRLQVRRGRDDATMGEGVAVSLVCPRCGHGASVRSNRAGRCAECGLGLKVTLVEPRCACGYLLYGLTADVCPECGRKVEERWSSDWEVSS